MELLARMAGLLQEGPPARACCSRAASAGLHVEVKFNTECFSQIKQNSNTVITMPSRAPLCDMSNIAVPLNNRNALGKENSKVEPNLV